VAIEAIVGIVAGELCHDGVARHFGDDGGCGNGEALGVALHDGADRAIELRRFVAVDEGELGPAAEGCDGLRHGPQRGLQDVLAVDAIDVRDPDADLRRGENVLVDGPTRLPVQGLAVGDTVREAERVEHHGGRDHWPRQRPTTRLIDASDGPAVQLEFHRLQLESRPHGRESLSPLGEASREGTRVSKEGELIALADRTLEEVGAQLRIALVEA
jgi:hypothetical protein